MKVQIQTAQNVTIEYEPADVGHRIGAAFVDLLVQGAYVVAIVLFMVNLNPSTLGGLGIIFFILAYSPLLFYHLLFEVFMDGQSIGKKAVNIKVVRLDGSQPTLGNYVMRWLLGLIEKNFFFGIIALITILVSGKGQRLGDMAAGTTVVRTSSKVSLADTIFVPTAVDYTPRYPQVVQLNDRDVAVIKEVIDSPTHAENEVMLRVLVDRVQGVMGVVADLPPLAFLRTVVNDYNHITSQL